MHQHRAHTTVADHQGAVEALLRSAWPVGTFDDGGSLPLAQALGRVLAADVHAATALPPFDNSQMDGFAVHSQDLHAAARLAVAPAIPAGSVPAPLARGHAAPIMTGAMLPDGADAVVPVEEAGPPSFAQADADGAVQLPATAAGSFVRAAGSDVPGGSLALAAGSRLTGGRLGLAAALGLAELPVRRRPRVLLLTTGDEVVAPGEPLPAGKIFDANSILLRTALESAGAEVIAPQASSDQPEHFLALLDGLLAKEQAGGGIDLIVSTGGISAGAFEVVKQALASQGVVFGHVGMQPGGPQGLGSYRGVPYLGFPGNPVSSVVSFEMFLRPALSAVVGAPALRPVVLAHLAVALDSPAGKHQVRRGSYEPPAYESPGTVAEVGGPSSHLVAALAAANALIQIPAGVTHLAAGAKVEVWLL
ncbi:molybdopterin molybdotransferase MoeA [Arthrobacter sp. 35W]|uniref:molybdopterin molybdotransferase MoeA n=1 Tax=Arthrobacter sp. 35W TaxID=1132441 RepID=UPI00047E1DE6|nr:gephyrin-like molybdotransferase Glp [Arthrobacter sp. 35W]